MPKFLIESDDNGITVAYQHTFSDNKIANYYLTETGSFSIYPESNCIFNSLDDIKPVIEKCNLIFFSEINAVKILSHDVVTWLDKLWSFPFFNVEMKRLSEEYQNSLYQFRTEFLANNFHSSFPYLLFFHYGNKYNQNLANLASSLKTSSKTPLYPSWESVQPSLSVHELNVKSAVAYALGIYDIPELVLYETEVSNVSS